jgi:hypothetical protein
MCTCYLRQREYFEEECTVATFDHKVREMPGRHGNKGIISKGKNKNMHKLLQNSKTSGPRPRRRHVVGRVSPAAGPVPPHAGKAVHVGHVLGKGEKMQEHMCFSSAAMSHSLSLRNPSIILSLAYYSPLPPLSLSSLLAAAAPTTPAAAGEEQGAPPRLPAAPSLRFAR